MYQGLATGPNPPLDPLLAMLIAAAVGGPQGVPALEPPLLI